MFAATLNRGVRMYDDSGGDTVGDFLGREGVFSFAEPTITISRSHIFGRRPAEGTYTQHSADAGSLSQAVDLTLEDFVRLTTALDDFPVPSTQTGERWRSCSLMS